MIQSQKTKYALIEIHLTHLCLFLTAGISVVSWLHALSHPLKRLVEPTTKDPPDHFVAWLRALPCGQS